MLRFGPSPEWLSRVHTSLHGDGNRIGNNPTDAKNNRN